MSALPDPRRIDVVGFAARGQSLEGCTPLAQLPRLCEDNVDADNNTVDWSVRGESRERAGGDLVLLHLRAKARVMRACQRCLEPVAVDLAIDRSLRFVHGEDEAARLDADNDDDVLALEATHDLLALIEDELLLALPIVPRHDRCVDLAALSGADAAAAEPAPNPFAALAALKTPPH